jgi:hypothetical protein
MAETRWKFDHDFREGAVRLVRETGKPGGGGDRRGNLMESALPDPGAGALGGCGNHPAV